MLKLAIDVGSTHTDAVLVKSKSADELETLSKIKFPTLKEGVTPSVISALEQVVKNAEEQGHVIDKNDINIHLGTTHFINALKQREDLEKVAIVRLALPASDMTPPFSSWPKEKGSLFGAVFGYSAILHGGCEVNGDIISKLSRAELESVAKKIIDKNIKQIVLSAPNSSVHPEMEMIAADVLRALLSEDVTISTSRSFPQGGILQRENVAALNASLREKAKNIFHELQEKLSELGFTKPLLVTRNDGAFMTTDEAIQKPFLAYSSGPINSIRGASLVTKFKEAIVVDTGGTTSDVGLLKNGSPYMTNLSIKEDGVEFVLDCAHQYSGALGGGTIISKDENGEVHLLKYSLQNHAQKNDGESLPLYQGGEFFTLTDFAIIKGRLSIEEVSRDAVCGVALKKGFSEEDFDVIDELMAERLAAVIEETRIDASSLPIILCGGGSCLFDLKLLEEKLKFPCKGIMIPENAEVVNAIGASNPVLRCCESVDYFDDGKEEKAKLVSKIKSRLIKAGAEENTVVLISADDKEYSYSKKGRKKHTVVMEGKLNTSVSGESFNSSFDEVVHVFDHEKVDIKKFLQDEGFAKKYLVENFDYAKCDVKEAENDDFVYLTEEEVEFLAIGAGYLGSGGGGDPALGCLAAQMLLRNGHSIKFAKDLSKFEDDDYVVVFGFGGMPEVVNEKLASTTSGPAVVQKVKELLEKKLGKKINLVAGIPSEIGGANPTLTAAQLAISGLPYYDGDGMARAFPSFLMTKMNIYGDFSNSVVVLAKENENGETLVIEEETFAELEARAFKSIGKNGGAMFMAMMPMTVKQAKELCIHGTASTAIKIGRHVSKAIENKTPIVEALNEVLEDTCYGQCEMLMRGVVISVDRDSDGERNFGVVVIEDEVGRRCKIAYQNENLVAAIDGKVVALTPDIITFLNPDTGKALGTTSHYHVGLRVEAIKIGAPKDFLDEHGKVRKEAKSILQGESINSLIKEATRVDDERVMSLSNLGGGMAFPARLDVIENEQIGAINITKANQAELN